MTLPGLTVLNTYTLTGSADQFRSAIARLAARVQTQGHPGVLAYRFFAHDTAALARAVVDYADPSAWIGHHDIAMDWPEMQALHAVATLSEVTFLGPLTPQIREWIAGSSLKARLTGGFGFAAGFVR